MTLVTICIIAVCALQCTRTSNAANRKQDPNFRNDPQKNSVYYNPWTPTYLLWGTPTIIQLQQPKPQNSLHYRTQLIYFNIGHPSDNPPRKYLPKEKTTTMSTLNRFGDDDDNPVWDVITPSSVVGPTRRNKVHAQTFPPVMRHENITPRSKVKEESLFRMNSNFDERKTTSNNSNNPSSCAKLSGASFVNDITVNCCAIDDDEEQVFSDALNCIKYIVKQKDVLIAYLKNQIDVLNEKLLANNAESKSKTVVASNQTRKGQGCGLDLGDINAMNVSKVNTNKQKLINKAVTNIISLEKSNTSNQVHHSDANLNHLQKGSIVSVSKNTVAVDQSDLTKMSEWTTVTNKSVQD
ncbi:hypothetical protein FQR65_LT07061 [Abscondita terminalis]|nr:hypothetical protein FQR65_LT07061 [Abscondita terminalis]